MAASAARIHSKILIVGASQNPNREGSKTHKIKVNSPNNSRKSKMEDSKKNDSEILIVGSSKPPRDRKGSRQTPGELKPIKDSAPTGYNRKEAYYVIKKVGDSSGNTSEIEDEVQIEKMKAICTDCRKSMTSPKLVMLYAECECKKTSLIHVHCMDKRSQAERDTCRYCLKKIECRRVRLSLITIEKKPKTPSVLSGVSELLRKFRWK